MITENRQLNTILTRFLTALVIVLVFGIVDVQRDKEVAQAVSNVIETPKPTPELITEAQKTNVDVVEVKSEKEKIEEYIREKFGKDADKAFLLLSGNENCGGENPRLDQRAVNINKDGSKDFGIFQINDKYHPVYRLNLHTDLESKH